MPPKKNDLLEAFTAAFERKFGVRVVDHDAFFDRLVGVLLEAVGYKMYWQELVNSGVCEKIEKDE